MDIINDLIKQADRLEYFAGTSKEYAKQCRDQAARHDAEAANSTAQSAEYRKAANLMRAATGETAERPIFEAFPDGSFRGTVVTSEPEIRFKPWNGGDGPPKDAQGQMVSVVLRSGRNAAGSVDIFRWEHLFEQPERDSDIIGYRVL